MKCSEVEGKFQVLRDLEKTQNKLKTAQNFKLDHILVTKILNQKEEIEELHGKINCKFCEKRVIKSQFSMSSLGNYQNKHRRSCKKFLKYFDLHSRICRICCLKLKRRNGETYDMHFAKYHSNLESCEMNEQTDKYPMENEFVLVEKARFSGEYSDPNKALNTETESTTIDGGSDEEMEDEIPDLEEGELINSMDIISNNKTCNWVLKNGEICGKTPNNLARHMMIHKDVRPFACSICEQTFRQKTHLQRHKRSQHYISVKISHKFRSDTLLSNSSSGERRKRKRSSRGSIGSPVMAPKKRRLAVRLNRCDAQLADYSSSGLDPNAEIININDDSGSAKEELIENESPTVQVCPKNLKKEIKVEDEDDVSIVEEQEIQISSVQSVVYNDHPQEPGEASLIYHCLFCTKVFWSEEFTLKHLLDFHAISQEYLSKFGLKIKVTHL